ncbi:MAG TPA: hypothetical protein VKE74_12845, partial [Gemmataceae bacterium]|nr:hypothetical protein [Gemmataceae bacterium]
DPPHAVELRRFSADGKSLLGWAGGWYSWDVATGAQRRAAIETDGYDAISPDGMRIVRIARSGDDARLEIVELVSGKVLHAHRGRAFGEICAWPDFTPDGKAVVASLWDGTTRVWAADTGRELVRVTGASGQPGASAVSADGRVLVTSDPSNKLDGGFPVRVWDLRTGQPVAKFDPGASVVGVRVSGDGRRVAASVFVQPSENPDPRVTVWDVASGKVLARVPQPGRTGLAALSPDGRTIAVSAWAPTLVRVIRVYEVASGTERFAFRHDGQVGHIVFSPDGKILAASSGEAPVYLWDLTGDRAGLALRWDPAAADQVWDDLATADGAKAFTAIRRLRANPTHAVPLLKARVKLVTPDDAVLKGLFADLSADDFQVREKATVALAGYDEALRPALEAELARTGSTEARRRLSGLVERLNGPTPVRTRLVRAVEAVEGMGTPEADAILVVWAGGSAGPTLAAEARAVLDRQRR